MALIDCAVGLAPHPPFDAFAPAAHDGVLTRLDPLHVNADLVAEDDAVLGGSSCYMSGAGAGHKGFGGRAAVVDAGAAEQLALDNSHLHPGLAKANGEKWPRLARAD